MRFAACATGLALALTASSAVADITHVVQRGHTLEAIAHRYRLSVKEILEANHLKDGLHLKPGQTLTIPGVSAKKKDGSLDKADKARASRAVLAHATRASIDPGSEPRGHGETNTVRAIRLGEEFRIRTKDAQGHIPPAALKEFERLMRQGSEVHAVDPRLLALVTIVSNHFEGKPIEVVSGYRAYTPTQYTPRSNHTYGRAIDVRIQGISNEAVRDFCRTLREAGCGYYPNSNFVHLDVRDTKAYWVDWSHPGEPPKYDTPGVVADEGTSDVPEDKGSPPEGLGNPMGSESAAPGSSETRGSPTPYDSAN